MGGTMQVASSRAASVAARARSYLTRAARTCLWAFFFAGLGTSLVGSSSVVGLRCHGVSACRSSGFAPGGDRIEGQLAHRLVIQTARLLPGAENTTRTWPG
jgi:hypothetical protein